MKKWIAIFSLLIFVAAGTAPVIAAVLDSNAAIVQVDEDSKKDKKKSDKKSQAKEKGTAAICESAAAIEEACAKTSQACSEKKGAEGKAVEEKK